MAYISQDDFETAFGHELTIELTHPEDPDATTVDADVFQLAADDGSSLINSYLRLRYILPVPVTYTLRRLNLDITRYLLGHGAQEDDVRQRYEDALRWLENIAQGTMTIGVGLGPDGLPGTDDDLNPMRENGPRYYQNRAPIMTVERLANF